MGGHIDSSKIRKRFHAACDRARLKRIRFHDPMMVKDYLGHSSIETTMIDMHYSAKTVDADSLSAGITAALKTF